MSLYAIGDLHLHYQSQLRAPGQLTEKVWKNHEERFRKNCALIRDSDTLVLVGDHSWGRNLDECEKDLQYIMNLPGRKVLLRGNHDMFWDAKKTAALNARFEGRLFFLQNNYFPYRDYALVGTKGYTFEGPFYVRGRRIVDWDREAERHAQQLVELGEPFGRDGRDDERNGVAADSDRLDMQTRRRGDNRCRIGRAAVEDICLV